MGRGRNAFIISYISFLLAPIAPGSQILNCFKDLYDACLRPLPPAMWDYVLTRTEIYYIGSHGWSIMVYSACVIAQLSKILDFKANVKNSSSVIQLNESYPA